MPNTPRLAIGTLQPGADRRPVLWAMLESLRRQEVEVQSFSSRACFTSHVAVSSITGRKVRYLDSWLMEGDVCREFFVHGVQFADLSVVDGEFVNLDANQTLAGGDLNLLCDWLRLPKIVVLDASRLAGAIPERPERVDGVLFDRVIDSQHLARWTTDVETVWRVPVLGSLPASAGFDRKIAAIPRGGGPTSQLLRELGDAMAGSWRSEELLRLAQAEGFPTVETRLFRAEMATLRLTVAVAFDEAFFSYFPCVLDILEARGATVIDFSPLRDEHLPSEAEVVLLGGGVPERFASTLADNHCMKTALRNHVRWGKRVYGEGGGLAVLCQQLIAPDGEPYRMAGLLPAVARSVPSSDEPVPVERAFSRPNWMGIAGATVRGYRDLSWAVEPLGGRDDFMDCGTDELDLMGTLQTVGSLLEIHFGAQTGLLNHFFYPHLCVPPKVNPW